jgi:hypothetical protein
MAVQTPEEIAAFVQTGCSFLALLGQAAEQLKRYSETFEQRGGQPVYGDDALQVVYISNDLEVWLTPERRAVIAELRTDI